MKISVVIPLYNAENTIIECVSSVLDQTYNKNIEIIIVNDGSTDNSNKILKEFIRKNNIKNILIIEKENGGVSSARNVGLKKSTGDFIALLDSDDIWLPKKLEKQVKILKSNTEIDFLGCNRNNEKTKIWRKEIKELTRIKLNDLLIKMLPQTSTAIFKKEILNDVGFYDETQSHGEDGNYWFRMICEGKVFYMMPESLVITGGGKYHYGESGLSADLSKMYNGEIKNYILLYNMKYIKTSKYMFIRLYSFLKYLRRIVLVNLRK